MTQRLEFYLLESTDYNEFSSAVQKRLNDGWLLHGGIFAFPDYYTGTKVETVRYLQAFVRGSSKNRKVGFATNAGESPSGKR